MRERQRPGQYAAPMNEMLSSAICWLEEYPDTSVALERMSVRVTVILAVSSGGEVLWRSQGTRWLTWDYIAPYLSRESLKTAWETEGWILTDWAGRPATLLRERPSGFLLSRKGIGTPAGKAGIVDIL